MRHRTKQGLLPVALVVLGAFAAPSASAVPPKKAPAAAAKPKEDPAAVAHKQFMEIVKDGSTKYVAKDVSGAIAAFQKATLLEPLNPLGYYFLGEAQLGSNDLAQAESAWLHASQVSDNGPPSLKGKIFFVIADLRERQKRWDDAKAAWGQYGELAAKFPDAIPFPHVAQERISMIDAMLNQDKAYEIVRKRIAEENALKAAGKPVR